MSQVDLWAPARRFAALPAAGQVIVACLVFAGLAAMLILAKPPWFDEGGYANPSYNLLTHGHLGMPIWFSRRPVWLRMEDYTYSQMPLSFLVQAGWFAVAGVGVIQMRIVSALFGVLLIVSVYHLVKRISGQHWVALLAALIVATDYNILRAAADGRMDMMCAGFGYAGLASFMALRRHRFGLAVLVSQALVVASGLTHPNGILYFLGLTVLTLYYDRGRLRPVHVAVAAVPYVVGAVGWGLYILQDVEAFYGQFFPGNYGPRVGGFLVAPFAELDRYLETFGFHRGGHPFKFLKTPQLVAYWGAVAGYLAVSRIRNESRIGPIVVLLGVFVAAMVLLITGSQNIYIIHVIPLYAAILASVVWFLVRQTRITRWAAAAVVTLLITIQMAGPPAKFFVQNDFRDKFDPVVERLRALRKPGDVMIASSEFGFVFGFEGEVIDDEYLGTRDGIAGDIVVMGERYKLMHSEMRDREPARYRAVRNRLAAEYKKVETVGTYDLYFLKENVQGTL